MEEAEAEEILKIGDLVLDEKREKHLSVAYLTEMSCSLIVGIMEKGLLLESRRMMNKRGLPIHHDFVWLAEVTAQEPSVSGLEILFETAISPVEREFEWQ